MRKFAQAQKSAQHCALQWPDTLSNVYIIQGVMIVVMGVICGELYYFSNQGHRQHGQPRFPTTAELTLQFATETVDNVELPNLVPVGRCINTLFVDKFATLNAVVATVPRFTHTNVDFIAALKLGVTLRHNLMEYDWVHLVLLALWDENYDSRGEIAAVKMAGWDHVCFVQELVPTWMAERVGSAHQFMSLNAFGMTGYTTVLVLPVASLALRDPYALFADQRHIISSNFTSSLLTWDESAGILFSCIPNKHVFQQAAGIADQTLNSGRGEASVLRRLFNVTHTSPIKGVCVLHLTHPGASGNINSQKGCDILVYVRPKPWGSGCYFHLGVTEVCQLWQQASTQTT
jgi:hypothetical protein